MYKTIVSLTLLICLFYSKSHSQECIDKSKKLINSFSQLSYIDSFNLEYIKEKETLYFSIFQEETQKKGYRLLIKDIHPEGVFILGDKIRILSINNGHKFVEESFKNGHRLSHNTNYIEIMDFVDLSKAEAFVSSMKVFVQSKVQKKKPQKEEIEIYMSPRKN